MSTPMIQVGSTLGRAALENEYSTSLMGMRNHQRMVLIILPSLLLCLVMAAIGTRMMSRQEEAGALQALLMEHEAVL